MNSIYLQRAYVTSLKKKKKLISYKNRSYKFRLYHKEQLDSMA